MVNLKIGDVVYTAGAFDRKERKAVYLKLTVTSETDKAFIVGEDGSINKRSGRLSLKGYRGTDAFYTGQEVWNQQWVETNQWRLAEAVKHLKDYEKLKQIANIAGYEAKTPEYIIE